jgi:hypothetical protein
MQVGFPKWKLAADLEYELKEGNSKKAKVPSTFCACHQLVTYSLL